MMSCTHGFTQKIYFGNMPDEDINKELSQFDHYEEYDSNKKYTTSVYKEDYGHGLREYSNILYHFGEKKYVAAKE